MNIGIMVPSNRPEKLHRFLESLVSITKIQNYNFYLSIVFQTPFRNQQVKNELRWIEENIKLKSMRYKFKETYLDKKTGLTNMCQARIDAYDKLKDDCDFIFFCDDDFVFTEKSACGYTSADSLTDCIKFMEENKSCGIIKQMGFLGGSGWGRQPRLVSGGWFETALGFLIRNDGEFMDKRLVHPGIHDDQIPYWTKIVQGFGIYFYHNCPTLKDPSKKVFEKGSSSEHPNINYSMDSARSGFMRNYKLMFGSDFKFGQKNLPDSAILMHREAAKFKNIQPSYDIKYKNNKEAEHVK